MPILRWSDMPDIPKPLMNELERLYNQGKELHPGSEVSFQEFIIHGLRVFAISMAQVYNAQQAAKDAEKAKAAEEQKTTDEYQA